MKCPPLTNLCIRGNLLSSSLPSGDVPSTYSAMLIPRLVVSTERGDMTGGSSDAPGKLPGRLRVAVISSFKLSPSKGQNKNKVNSSKTNIFNPSNITNTNFNPSKEQNVEW